MAVHIFCNKSYERFCFFFFFALILKPADGFQQQRLKPCFPLISLGLPERLTFRDVQSPQEFRHGETAEVVCDVISSPVPLVVWYYQDREITEEHSKCSAYTLP